MPGPGHLEAARHLRGEGAGAGTAGPAAGARTPGPALVRPGAADGHVTRPGAQPVRKGFGRFHPFGPGPHRGDADRRAVAAFRRAQGRRGGGADGCPGPDTRRRPFA
ncbi:peptidoglycan-binding protein [Streptomyces sp. NPDC058294]|uniref:peptidoglycan-binding protein n=1 Tax=Streptomyces sp. NPDC058294 TaxID=3346430 RepID=UPI0036E00EB0